MSGWYYGSGFDLNVSRAVRLFTEGEGIDLSDKSRILTAAAASRPRSDERSARWRRGSHPGYAC